jgi:hypothetical protein
LLHLADAEQMNVRFTVVLNVDGQIITASSVHEVSATTEMRTLPGTGGGLFVRGRGEALRVELPGKPSFYFLIADRGGNEGWYGAVIEDCGLNDDALDPVARLDKFRAFAGPCELSRRSIPLVVRFARGEDDPSLVQEVRFPERSGPDGTVNLVSVTVERTDDEVSDNIPKELPWLAHSPLIKIETPRGLGKITASLFLRR